MEPTRADVRARVALAHAAMSQFSEWLTTSGVDHELNDGWLKTTPTYPTLDQQNALPDEWEHLFVVGNVHAVRTPHCWTVITAFDNHEGTCTNLVSVIGYATLGELSKALFRVDTTLTRKMHDDLSAVFARCVAAHDRDPEAEAFLSALLGHPSIPDSAYLPDPFNVTAAPTTLT